MERKQNTVKYDQIYSNLILHGSSFERLLQKVARDFAIFGPESLLVRMDQNGSYFHKNLARLIETLGMRHAFCGGSRISQLGDLADVSGQMGLNMGPNMGIL